MAGIINLFARPGKLSKALFFVVFLASVLIVPASPAGAFSGIHPDAGSEDPDYGASMVVDLLPGSSGSVPRELTVIGAAVFFRADDDDSGTELWMTLPPYIDAILVADIAPGDAGSFPEELTVHQSSLFFSADDGVNGRELWVTEPPYNSAHLVADINPGRDSSNPHELTPIGTTVVFAADDGSSGIELWKTQQPFNEALRVADVFAGGPGSNPEELTLVGWNLFFAATNGDYRELWMSGPPYTGAVQVSDINSEGFADPEELVRLDDMLFFTAVDPVYGREVWLSDAPYNPVSTRPLNNFSVCEEAPEPDEFSTCWRNTNPYDLHVIGDTLFFTANIGMIGFELWKSQPPYEPTSTNRVDDLAEGPFQSSFPNNKVSIGETLFFTASKTVDGEELWRTDPPYNEDSTFQVDDIFSGPPSSSPMELTPAGRTLFFTATNGVDGREVWLTKPPYREASMVQDVYLGAGSSQPTELTSLGDLLFFQATSRGDGAELWKVLTGYWLPDTGFAPGIVTPLQPQPAVKAYADMDQMQLELPRLGLTLPIVGVPALGNGWDLSWLGNQVGYLEGTAFPTWTGNTVLTAHAYLQDGYPGPFARLENLSYGDRLIIHAFGQRMIYEVRSSEELPPQDLSAFRHEELDWLTLITCKGWDPTTNRYDSRIVVRAVLVDSE